jgi:hypothetical protein
MEKVLFESKAWNIILGEEGEIFLENKRFASEGRYESFIEITAETVENAEMQGVKIPKYIREELAGIFAEIKEVENEEAAKIEEYTECVIVDAKHGQFAFFNGRGCKLDYKDEFGNYSFDNLVYVGVEEGRLKFTDGYGSTLHIDPNGITYVWIHSIEEPVKSIVPIEVKSKMKMFSRYNELIMKALKFELSLEENQECNDLYRELKLSEGNNLYELMQAKYNLSHK